MQMKKLTAFILLVCILLTAHSSLAVNITAGGACVLDFETGETIYEKNADASLVPASLTKVMTLYMLYEGLERGDYQKDTQIPISQNAAKLSRSREATNVVLKSPSYSVDELIKMMTIVSACAACTAFGEYISGSEADFAALMTKRAEELGLSAYFEDASGLSDNNRITPRSMAALTKMFIQKYPDILEYTSLNKITIENKVYDNTNLLLSERKYFYNGVDGFKTGTTNRAGKCLVSTAKKDGARVISVNMKSTTNDARYQDATKLINYAFEHIDLSRNSIFSTDIKTFVKGTEIPCYYYFGGKNQLLIIAENLNNYGFSTSYDPTTRTLYLYERLGKEITGIPVTPLPAGQKLHSIYRESTPAVILVKDGVKYPLNTVYSLNGQCLIDVDELKNYYPYTWDGELRTANLAS